jgi:sensor histidine kinase YesM
LLAEQKLSVSSTQRKILILSIVGIVLAAGAVVFLINLRHKNEKLKLQQRAADLEMQALRAQMNPHFIFNCLSAINHFILNNETDKASDYLTQFSRLLRMVLVNAGKPVVTLEEEVSMLRLYLNMEQLRFKDAFDYFIYADADVQPSMINVPSFILQPFCENAIWHGLLHKEGKGKLDVHLRMDGDVLVCAIKDNGIGMERAAQLKTRSADKIGSFGHKLSAERLALFNGGIAGASFFISDVKDEKGQIAGTSVILRINSKQEYD